MEKFSNEQALEQVRLYWANHLGVAAAGGGGRSGGGAAAAAAPAGGSAATAASRGGGLSSLARAAAAAAVAEEEKEQGGNISNRNGGRIGDRIGGGAGKDLSGVAASNGIPVQQMQQRRQQQQQTGGRGGGGGAPIAVTKDAPPTQHHQHMRPNTSPQAAPVAGIGLREVAQSAPVGSGGGSDGSASERKVHGRGHAASEHVPAANPEGDGRVVGRRRSGSGGAGTGAGREAATEAMRGPLVEALHQIAQVYITEPLIQRYSLVCK